MSSPQLSLWRPLSQKENCAELMDERELIEEACKGSLEAFTELYRSYINHVHVVICRFINKSGSPFSEEDKEEIAVQVLSNFWKKLVTKEFDLRKATARTYLGVCTWNACLDLKKSKYMQQYIRTVSTHKPISGGGENGKSITVEDTLKSSSISPSTQAIMKQASDLLKEVLPKAGLTKKEELVLRYWAKGLKQIEIAELMGISIKAVGGTIARAGKKCRRAFQRIGIHDFDELWEEARLDV